MIISIHSKIQMNCRQVTPVFKDQDKDTNTVAGSGDSTHDMTSIR